jgi:hypothetical protein
VHPFCASTFAKDKVSADPGGSYGDRKCGGDPTWVLSWMGGQSWHFSDHITELGVCDDQLATPIYVHPFHF